MSETYIPSRDNVPLKRVLPGYNAPFAARKVGEEGFLDFEPMSEYPFHFDEVDTLLATSASSPLVLVASSRVGSGYKVNLTGLWWRKPTNEAWSEDLQIQDTAGNDFAVVPGAAILSAAYGSFVDPTTFGDALFNGGDEGRGVQVVATGDEAAGDIEIRVTGTIVPI